MWRWIWSEYALGLREDMIAWSLSNFVLHAVLLLIAVVRVQRCEGEAGRRERRGR